ncbi:MAG: Zn-dependent hydrolase [Alphaproteobacteria bacterium]
MSEHANLRIDGARLWDMLMESGRIGPGRAGGLRRLALSDADRDVRDLFRGWCEAAGLSVTVDALGNMFGRRAGTDDSLPPVLIGSHLDSQIAGGKFDGPLGVLGALEVVRTLNDAGIRTKRPIEVVNWSNEEGARFQPPMSASAVFAGLKPLDWGLDRTDADGLTFGGELERIGYAGKAPVGGRPVDAYFEVHIEQGPELEAKGVQIGVVAGSYAVRGFDLEVHGETAHTGPTPMPLRRNALVGAAMLIVDATQIAIDNGPDAKSTAAKISVWPNLAGILPDYAKVTIDFRAPRRETLAAMLDAFEGAKARAAEKANVRIEVADSWSFGDEPFDPDCVALVREAAAALGYSHMDMPSQAGHDAYNLAHLAPTALIFSPCEKGITHNEAESCTLDQIVPATNVLLQVTLKRADR